MFKFITQRHLIVNILVGLLLATALVLGSFSMLNWFTHHGKYERIPSVAGQSFDAAKALLESKGFTVAVADSIFDPNAPRLQVMRQTPEADAMVKYGRTVYLTINKLVAPQVAMPNLAGLSLKSAEMYLQTVGLRIGDTIYKPDFTKPNTILSQQYNGNDIKPGAKIDVGSKITLVLSSGMGSEEHDMPNLIGLTYSQATSLLASLGASISIPILVDNVTDTANAFITRQEPPAFTEIQPGQRVYNKIKAGQFVDVWLSIQKPIVETPALTDSAIITDPTTIQ